ncbi:MAG: ROK family transcriptional regulator [Lapillicoccus sp.]
MKSSATATAPLLRRLNASAVLGYLTGAGSATGSEIMTATDLSRPTVHAACDDLIGLGWVVEVEGRRPEGDGRPGRPARCYRFNAVAGYVLAVDLGEWKVSVRVADLQGQALADTVVEFSSNRAAAQERIRGTRQGIRRVLRQAGVDPGAVLSACVGVAAAVHPDGRIYPSQDPGYLPGLADLNIAEAVGRGYPWTVLVENDANLAVLAERWQGVAVGVDDVVLVLAGERMGAGIVAGGRLLRGATGAAGELALFELVDGVGDTHGIGATTRMQGEAAVRTARRTGSPAYPGSLVDLTGGDPDRVTGALVEEAALNGDPVAAGIIDHVARRMARVVGVLATLLNPSMVVVGGGAVDLADRLRAPILAQLPAFVKEAPLLEVSALGETGALVGAVRHALDHAEQTIYQTL